MDRVADDLRHRSVVGENDISHADEIIVEQRAKNIGFQRLHQRREARNVGEQSSDLATLSPQVERFGIAGEPLSQVWREVARQRRVRPLRCCLPLPRLAQDLDMPDGLGDGRFEVGKIDRLDQKVESAAVHRRANIGHVAVGRDDDGRDLFFGLLQLLQEGKPVHARHVDVGDHHVDGAVP